MNDVEVLAQTLFGEARARDVEDAEAIACVVLNRVGYRNWPGTIAEVCLQPWQFSCWLQHDDAHARNLQRILTANRNTSPWFDLCWQIAERAVAGKLTDKTRTSTHYHTRAVAPRWSKGKTPVYETQGHIFFNNIDTPAPRTVAEALEIERPITATRTVRAGELAAGATVMSGAIELFRDQVQHVLLPIAGFLDPSTLKLALAALAIGAVAHMIFARLDDRRRGLR